MVTKGYQKGVYERVTKGIRGRVTSSVRKNTTSSVGGPVPNCPDPARIDAEDEIRFCVPTCWYQSLGIMLALSCPG